MNSFMNLMNQAGEIFGRLAWPMFWQSCVLIAALLAADLVLRTKARASVRYGLWLVVLVKLCLPPTLALPTSPVWWLHDGTPPPVVKRAVVHYAVTYSDEVMPVVTQPMAVMTPPKIVLSAAAVGLMVSLAVSLFLLGWLAVRWWQIGRKVRQAEESIALTALCGEAERALGMKSAVRVRIAPGTMSPAVCGLFRATILVPRALLEQFSEEQLRAVLLHELIHVRRRDVLVNFAQSLIQIVYWWHPLLWVANTRIRQVREEAVDDAVMLALREEAEAYAPTLLEVAKLALNHPLASLGLVGILESRQALRERIEQLMDFRPPRRAGLTLASLLGIVAFMAVTLPMGQRPVQAAEETETITETVTQPNINQAVVIQGEFYRVHTDGTQPLSGSMIRGEFYPAKEDGPPWYNAGNHTKVGMMADHDLDKLLAEFKSQNLEPFARPRVQTYNGLPADFYVANGTNSFELEYWPVVKGGKINLTYNAKFERDVLDDGTADFGGKFHEMQGHLELPDGGGMMILTVDTNNLEGGKVLAVFKVQLITNALSYGHAVERLQSVIRRKGDTNASQQVFAERLQSVLRRVGDTNAADPRTAEQLQAIIQRAEADTNDDSVLRTRNYMIDVQTFEAALQAMQGGTNSIDFNNSVAGTAAVRDFLTDIGVNLKSPSGKSIFYNHKNGLLLVHSTKPDLDVVERAIQGLTYAEPQIHIEARFVKVPSGTVNGYAPFVVGSNNVTDGIVSILNPDAARSVMHDLESRKGAMVLAEPEVVTSNGRRAEVRATQVTTLVTGCTNDVVITRTNHTNNITFQTEPREFGSALNETSRVLSDGRTISVEARATYSEFLGYAGGSKKMATDWITNSFGEKVPLPIVLTAAQKSQATTSVNLSDGQTVMLVLPPAQQMRFGPRNDAREALVAKHIKDAEKKTGGEKEVIVFLTATLVDAAGNRIHTDNQLPAFEKTASGRTVYEDWEPNSFQP